MSSRELVPASVPQLAEPDGVRQLVDDFFAGRKETTLRTYRPGLSDFADFLEEGPSRQQMKATRDHAILRLLFDLALRRSPVTALDVEDVNLEARTLQVWIKGADEQDHQTRSLPRPTGQALRDWIGLRGDHPGPLFVALDPKNRGRRLTGTSIWRIVDDIARAVGERVWPHAVRHSSISEVVDRSRDVRLGRIQAGHTSISTTEVYIDNLESRDLDQQASRIAADAPRKAVHGPHSHPAGDAASDEGQPQSLSTGRS